MQKRLKIVINNCYLFQNSLFLCPIKLNETIKQQNKMENSTYTLTKTTLKNGKFHYVVTDNNGNIISERKSNREYVACTIHGGMFFGRLDLIGKGDHGRYIKDWNNTLNMSFEQMSKNWGGELTIERFNEIKKERAEWLKDIQTIAYLNN